MARLLVTGGAGFIGCNFVHYWLREHAGGRVVVVDALTYAGDIVNLDPVQHRTELRFVHGNICDTALIEQLLQEERLDTIVHFAAESHVDRSITGPDAFIETNIAGTHSLLKAARQVWLEEQAVPQHRFHHVSTDEVYGSLEPDDPPFTETTLYSPNSPYSATKAASDHLVRAYHHTYGLRTTITNCSNNYGPYHFPEKLIPLLILNVLHGRPLPIYGDGRNVRDWLHVEDHCRGIDFVLQRGRVGATYNLGGDNERTNLQVVERICGTIDELFRSDPGLAARFPGTPAAHGRRAASLLTFVKDRPGHDRRYAIDSSLAGRELDYRAQVAFEDGLRRTILWYLGHESWWRRRLPSP